MTQRIEKLEVKIAFLEENIEELNQQLSSLTQEFILAKQAMQHMYQRLQQVQSLQGEVKDPSEETPPPHY